MPSEQCSDGILFSIRQTALHQADKIGIRATPYSSSAPISTCFAVLTN
ncbi:TPA: hypothetical protein ACFP4U_001061 [Neisseria lactamica]|nr:hypothetical protein [Neisseria lactamica]